MSGLRTFVTGASGLVGEAVCRSLLERGHEVVGLVRNRERGRAVREAGVQVVVGDMTEPETYRRHAADAEAVIHCAELRLGGTRVTGSRLAAMAAADETMIRTLAAVCEEQGSLLLYTSGCWVYGDHGDDWIDESTPYAPSRYAAAHARGSEWLLERARGGALRAAVIVPGMVYGPGSWFANFVRLLERGRVKTFGPGHAYWSNVHWRDLGHAYALAVERAQPGRTYNVVDDEPVRHEEWLRRLAALVGQPPPARWPLWVGRLVLGAPLADTMTLSFRVRNRRAADELGWRPRYPTIGDGMPEVVHRVTRGRHGRAGRAAPTSERSTA